MKKEKKEDTWLQAMLHRFYKYKVLKNHELHQNDLQEMKFCLESQSIPAGQSTGLAFAVTSMTLNTPRMIPFPNSFKSGEEGEQGRGP